MSPCPTCGADVATANAEQGEILTCGDCGTELEVVSLDPLTIATAPETQEDWGE
jgi:alpha-aminoadipate carrier protein LysW